MTPDELLSKLRSGDQLLVRQRVFHRLSYTGSARRPHVLGLIEDEELARSLVSIPGNIYTSDFITYAEFEDPDERKPRESVFQLISQRGEPLSEIETIDKSLSKQLAHLSASDIADLVQLLRPPMVPERGRPRTEPPE